MSNLISEQQKKAVKKEYLLRLFSVLMFIPTSLLGIFLLAYVIPYYLALEKKDTLVAELFKPVINAENRENVGENVSALANKTLEEMRAVEIYNKDIIIPSNYFDQIIENKNSDIKIIKLSFSIIKAGQGQFLVSGVSQSRAGLVTYIEDLKSKAGFASVESPVSDFAKDSDIAFTFNLKTGI